MFKKFLKDLKEGFIIQNNVISALLYREVNISLSKTSLGILGVFIEPLIILIIFVLISSVVNVGLNPNMNIFIFFTIGLLLFRIFAETALGSAELIKRNKPLFFYRPVKPIDTIFTKTIVNSCLSTILMIFIIFVTSVYTEKIILNDFPLMVLSITLLSIFGFSFGIIFMVAGHRFNPITKVLRFIRRPLFITSGIFFESISIPPQAWKFIGWNPIFHAIELTRLSSTYGYKIANQISLSYLFESTIVVFLFALIIYSQNKHLLMRS